MGTFHTIDMNTDPRQAHFAYFSSMADPYAGLTVEVDISDLMAVLQSRKLNFFRSFLYCVGRAANAVPQLRRRIRDGQVVEYDNCPVSPTILRENGTYGYCQLDCSLPFDQYEPLASKLIRQAKQGDGLDEGGDPCSLLFVSSLPWLRYSELHQPTPIPADSNPRICWGKYAASNGRTTLPLSLLANHALVDGLHIAAFYQAVEQELARFAALTAQP